MFVNAQEESHPQLVARSFAMSAYGEYLHGLPLASQTADLLISEIAESSRGETVLIDFSHVVAASGAFLELIASRVIRERGARGVRVNFGKFVFIWNANDDVLRTCDIVLRALRDAALALLPFEHSPPTVRVLGTFPRFLNEVMNLLQGRRSLTSKELAELLGLKLTASAERLRQLHEWGFVFRMPTIQDSRPTYRYWLPMADHLKFAVQRSKIR